MPVPGVVTHNIAAANRVERDLFFRTLARQAGAAIHLHIGKIPVVAIGRGATEHEEARGCVVERVEAQNRGFDLISRRPHPEDPKTAVEVRFIEVKGRAHVGEVALSTNEYKTAERLKKDYWLYVVFNCATNPEVHVIQDPARLGWKPVVKVEHYSVGANEILLSETKNE